MHMEIFSILKNATITIPIFEIAILISALSIFLVARVTRIGLITAYLFSYRWGLTFCQKEIPSYLVFYLVFGFAIGLLTVVSILWASANEKD